MSARPLAGRRVVVTRARAQAASLCQQLAEAGARPVLLPAIETAPLPDYAPLAAALADPAGYDWLVFTSANGVEAFWRHGQPERLAAWPGLRLAAIGPATARALAAQGWPADCLPEEYVAEGLAAALGAVRGQRVLIANAEQARDVLRLTLEQAGAWVREVAVYRTRPAVLDAAGLAELRQGVAVVTFASPSAVHNLQALLPADAWPAVERAVIACLGPITAQAARAAGLNVAVQANPYTVAGLVASLAAYYSAVSLPKE